jgi:hypothetical protein
VEQAQPQEIATEVTGFNSFSPAHPSAPREQSAGSFGDANTFYGVPDTGLLNGMRRS